MMKMTSVGKQGKVPERSSHDQKQGKVSEDQWISPTVKEKDIAVLTIRSEHFEKLRVPRPPKASPKTRAKSCVLVRKTRAPNDPGVKVSKAKPLPKIAALQPLDCMGLDGPRFDAQGMVLPHSILGSLEDFRKEMEARGEMELIKRIPVNKQRSLDFGSHKLEEKSKPHLPYEQDHQGHALDHWFYHMVERRRQQNFIANLLQMSVEDLLMNQSNRFRETLEQREVISQRLPALQHGHGAYVGSELWNVPQRFGDELSGIMATLTQKERGHVKHITHISQPNSTRLESGNVRCERSVSRAWSHSQYLKHRQNELRHVLSDLDWNQPDMEELEIVGSSHPFTADSDECCRKQEQNEEDRSENKDPLALYDDIMLDVELLPALRINDELVRWTGSPISHPGEVGVFVYMTFEAVVGESTCSYLELKNVGSTAIYYSWQKVERSHSFPEATINTHTQQFYFNTATAAILPGDTERILFTFKPECAGIKTEPWKLNTHPVLMGGATLQVTLKGMALFLDKTAKQREALELKLEKRVARSVCWSVVSELVSGIHSPQRPSSPAELYLTEEEHFHAQNLNLYYHHKPVEALKSLWEKAKRSKATNSGDEETEHTHGPVWDLSMSSLHSVLVSLPDADIHPEMVGLCSEDALSQYNALWLLHLSPPASRPQTMHNARLLLWTDLLEGLSSEAVHLRHVMGLPASEIWGDPHAEDDNRKELEKEGIDKKAVMKDKEEKKGATRPAAKIKPAERKKKTKEEEKMLVVSTTISPDTESTDIKPEVQQKYRHALHQKVYALMEEMIDSLADLLEKAEQPPAQLQSSDCVSYSPVLSL